MPWLALLFFLLFDLLFCISSSISHCSVDRLFQLRDLAKSWEDDVVVALYLVEEVVVEVVEEKEGGADAMTWCAQVRNFSSFCPILFTLLTTFNIVYFRFNILSDILCTFH
jgi:hypothetical protein